jgi:hypothetical protein
LQKRESLKKDAEGETSFWETLRQKYLLQDKTLEILKNRSRRGKALRLTDRDYKDVLYQFIIFSGVSL